MNLLTVSLIIIIYLKISASRPCSNNFDFDFDISRQNDEFVENENNIYSNGDYEYSFIVPNQMSQKVQGTLQNVNEKQVYVVKGRYAYLAPDNYVYVVEYIADENGYRVTTMDRGPLYLLDHDHFPSDVIDIKLSNKARNILLGR